MPPSSIGAALDLSDHKANSEVCIGAAPNESYVFFVQDRFVFDAVSDSTRGARDEIHGIDTDDFVDLTALGFEQLIFSGQPGSGKLLVREIGEGTNWEATMLTGGWAASDFELRTQDKIGEPE